MTKKLKFLIIKFKSVEQIGNIFSSLWVFLIVFLSSHLFKSVFMRISSVVMMSVSIPIMSFLRTIRRRWITTRYPLVTSIIHFTPINNFFRFIFRHFNINWNIFVKWNIMSDWNRNWYILVSRKSMINLMINSFFTVSVLSRYFSRCSSVDWIRIKYFNI